MKEKIINALLVSDRYQAAVATLDVTKMACEPPINFDSLSTEEGQEMIAWARGDIDEMPQTLGNYINRCR